MRKKYTFNLYAAGIFFLGSISAIGQTFDNGILILNEGGAGSGNASVSFTSLENGNPIVSNNIYAEANPGQDPLGDTAQSMTFAGDNAYIVLNISNTVKVANRHTFAHVATISEGLVNPRYMAVIANRGYITNWGSGTDADDDYIAIFDLPTNAPLGTITMDEGIERIVAHEGKLYVAHQGGFGFGNKISIIDPMTNTVEAEITVGDVPNSMLFKDGFLYVLCGGKPFWSPEETDGRLDRIDLSDNSVTTVAEFDGLHPANLELDALGNIYFSSDEVVFKSTLASPTAFAQLFTLEPQGAYGIYGMDLIDNQLYVADAGDYVSPGTAFVFDTDGNLQHDYTVGVIPNSFYKAESTLQVKKFDALAFTLYPNPTSEKFFLNTDQTPQVSIFDPSGRMILSQVYSVSGINVAAFPAGIYMVSIAQGSQQSTSKLIVR